MNIQSNTDKYLYEQAQFRHHYETKNKQLGNLNFLTENNRLNNVVEDSENIIDLLEQRNDILSNNDYLSNNAISYQTNQKKPKQIFIQHRKTSLGFDSETRDTTSYLYQNNYKISLRKPFSNIVSIKMKDSIFINTQQLIRETPLSQKNNVIQWNIKDDIVDNDYIIYTTTLTPGNYTETSFSTEIETQMNSVIRANGSLNNFSVSIDSVTDIVSFTSISFTVLANPLSFSVPPELQNYTEITVTFTAHGFTVGNRIYIENAITVGGMNKSIFNQSHIITSVQNVNNFSFQVPVLAISNETSVGGLSIKIGGGNDFQLLWSSNNSPATILGFSKVDTGFATEHTNTKEAFNDEEKKRIKINYLRASSSLNEATIIRTEIPHRLTTGDRIYLYTDASKLSSSSIIEYNHLYGLSNLSDIDDENLRKAFVGALTAPSGLIVTDIGSNEISVPIPYITIAEVEEKIALVDDDDVFGDVIIKDKNLPIDLTGEKYIYMCSPEIGGDMIDTSGRVIDVFAKIQLAGKANSTIFNGFSGGSKVYYDKPLKSLGEIEFYFRKRDGTLFEFNDKNHSFVLEITEAVQKLEDRNLSYF